MMINIHQSQSLPLTQIGKRKLRSYLVTKMLVLMQKLRNDIEPEINPDTSFIGCELDIELEPISVPNPDTLFIGCEPDIEPEINSVPLTLDPDISDIFGKDNIWGGYELFWGRQILGKNNFGGKTNFGGQINLRVPSGPLCSFTAWTQLNSAT